MSDPKISSKLECPSCDVVCGLPRLIAQIDAANDRGCFPMDWWPQEWRSMPLGDILALCDRTEEKSCTHPEGAMLSRTLQALRRRRALDEARGRA